MEGEGLGATLSFVCELITLPMLSRGSPSAWYWLCSGLISSIQPPLGLSAVGPHSFQELSPALMQLEDAPQRVCGGGWGAVAQLLTWEGCQKSFSEDQTQADLHPADSR